MENKEIIFRLIDKDGYCKSEFRCSRMSEASIEGELYNVTGWSADDKKSDLEYEFVSNAYIKWDACSHFRFYGEDYKEEKVADSYYHICGDSGYFDFMRAIAFVFKVARDNMPLYDTEEFDNILKLNLLEGYTIEKCTK